VAQIDDLATWKSTFLDLPKVANSSWAANFANWVGDRVTNNELTNITAANIPFDFDRGVFQTQLELSVQTISALVGITQFATAWEISINASLTLNVISGDFTGGGSPAETWSTVSSATIDAASILAGKAIILTLIAEAPVDVSADSRFPEIFRNAFLALTGTVSGINSLAIPTPLVVANTPLI
jgi:hypothetical protein